MNTKTEKVLITVAKVIATICGILVFLHIQPKGYLVETIIQCTIVYGIAGIWKKDRKKED